MTRCPHYSECSAPLCPDDTNLECAVWYPGEQVCKRQGVDFAAIQRKIIREGIGGETCFTVLMLRRKAKVSKGLRGLDPERPRAEALASWLMRHKGVAPLSEEKRAQLRERMLTVRRADSLQRVL
jgi:hypothetical protein